MLEWRLPVAALSSDGRSVPPRTTGRVRSWLRACELFGQRPRQREGGSGTLALHVLEPLGRVEAQGPSAGGLLPAGGGVGGVGSGGPGGPITTVPDYMYVGTYQLPSYLPYYD